MARLPGLLAAAALLSAPAARAGALEDAAELRKDGKKQEAVALLEKAAEADAKNCALRRALGEGYFDLGDVDLGAMTLERFLKDCPTDKAASAVGEKLARHYDRKMEAGAPDDGKGGVLYLVPLPKAKERGGGTDDDRWAYENYSRTDKLTAVEQAVEHLRMNKHREAVAVLVARVKKKPGDAQAWRFLGTARALAGDRAGAVKAYEKYLELEPDAPDAEPIRKTLPYARR